MNIIKKLNTHKFLFIFLITILVTIFIYQIFLMTLSYEGFETNNPKIAIITSIYGNYDNLKENHINDENDVNWYCFTDNKNLKSDKWKIINEPYHLKDKDNYKYKEYYNYYDNIKDDKIYNMMCAKYYKIKTHNIDILKNYDYYIWVDGSITLRPDFIKNIKKILMNNDIKIINFKHSARDNIKDELNVSLPMNKYKSQKIKEQYDYYISNGFKDDYGLYENTSFVKKNDEQTNKIFDDWWIENLKWSYQDQISYPFVLYKSNKKPDYIINENVFSNEDYTYVDFNYYNNHVY